MPANIRDTSPVNPLLDSLQPYPFEKLRALTQGIKPPTDRAPISFGIGEPKHSTPQFIRDEMVKALAGLSVYPATAGSDLLRTAVADWIERRYKIPRLDPARQVLPVAGTREALFAIAQLVVDASRGDAVVVCPNPFYQIYEGAALLAGARVEFANAVPARGNACDYGAISDEVWRHTQLLYACSPGNPTGAVMNLEQWRELFELSDRYGFVIASDECYSEIYFTEGEPPLGALQAAHQLGRDYQRLLVFSSLSKRSNVPGLRSGFVAGDAELMKHFLLYRTYQGCALSSVVQQTSVAAWNDEQHVRINRGLYAKKFAAVVPMLATVLDVGMPDASFYLWANVERTGLSDTEFATALLQEQNVTVLPGSFLARDAHGINPGRNYVRIALVAEQEECLEGVRRIVQFCQARELATRPTAAGSAA